MFDVGDLPVLTFDNCVLKAAVIKWPVKLYIRFFTFFQNSKKRLFTFFELLHTFSRTLDVSVDEGKLVKFWKLSASASISRHFKKDSLTLQYIEHFFHNMAHIS